MMVARVLRAAHLKPHRLRTYMMSDDPNFESKAADIIGLYMDPPQHAAVFCMDEKTAIQALDRPGPVLPISPGRAEKHGFEYYRHGTPSLDAALDVKTGQVHGKTARRHTSEDFLAFLTEIVKRTPVPKKSTSCSTTSPRTRPGVSPSSSSRIRECDSTLRRPVRRGSIRSKSGSRKSSAM